MTLLNAVKNPARWRNVPRRKATVVVTNLLTHLITLFNTHTKDEPLKGLTVKLENFVEGHVNDNLPVTMQQLERIRYSPGYTTFLENVGELSVMDMSVLVDDDFAKLSFFLNLYHLLLLHAATELGSEFLKMGMARLFPFYKNHTYRVSELGAVSLLELEHCYLRANTSPPAFTGVGLFLPSKIDKKDSRIQYVPRPQPLVSFALCNGVRSSGRICIFPAEPSALLRKLHATTRSFFLLNLRLDERAGTILLPRILDHYQYDFVGTGRRRASVYSVDVNNFAQNMESKSMPSSPKSAQKVPPGLSMNSNDQTTSSLIGSAIANEEVEGDSLMPAMLTNELERRLLSWVRHSGFLGVRMQGTLNRILSQSTNPNVSFDEFSWKTLYYFPLLYEPEVQDTEKDQTTAVKELVPPQDHTEQTKLFRSKDNLTEHVTKEDYFASPAPGQKRRIAGPHSRRSIIDADSVLFRGAHQYEVMLYGVASVFLALAVLTLKSDAGLLLIYDESHSLLIPSLAFMVALLWMVQTKTASVDVIKSGGNLRKRQLSLEEETQQKGFKKKMIAKDTKQKDDQKTHTRTYPFSFLDDHGRPDSSIFRVNEIREFENDLFKGKAMLMVRAENDRDMPLVRNWMDRHPKQQLLLNVQGQFKKRNKGAIMMGIELMKPLEMGFMRRNMMKMLMSVVRTMSKDSHFSFGEDPADGQLLHLCFPLNQMVDFAIETKPGEPLPDMKTLNETKSTKGVIDRAASPFFYEYNPEYTYSFSFFSDQLDFISWSAVNIPGFSAMSLTRILDDQPAGLVAYEIDGTDEDTPHKASSNIYLFRYYLQRNSMLQF